ncbi:MAG: amino acid kinase family protein, partial [Alphaproteobacteria bacterium]
DCIRNVAGRVKAEIDAGNEVAVAVSAMAGVTNELVGYVNGISKIYDAREYDSVVAAGEQISSGLLALALQELGVAARSWLSWQIPIHTDGVHGKARIQRIESVNLLKCIKDGVVPI